MTQTKISWSCPSCPAKGTIVEDSTAPAMTTLAAIMQDHLHQSPTCPTPRKIRMETEQVPVTEATSEVFVLRAEHWDEEWHVRFKGGLIAATWRERGPAEAHLALLQSGHSKPIYREGCEPPTNPNARTIESDLMEDR